MKSYKIIKKVLTIKIINDIIYMKGRKNYETPKTKRNYNGRNPKQY